MSDTNVTADVAANDPNDNPAGEVVNEGGTATKKREKKTFEMKEIHGVFRVFPEDLVIADDREHPLYDERKDYPLDKSKVSYNKENGIVGSVLTAIRSPDKRLMVVDGRQRTSHLRAANVLRVAEGLEPFAVEVRVLHGVSLAEAADLMEMLNSFRTDDSFMVLARKALRRFERLKSQAEKDGQEFKKKEVIESTATIFACSPQTIQQRLLAMTACDEAQAACEAEKIGFGDLVEIAKLETKEQQLAMLEACSVQRINFDGPQESPENGDGTTTTNTEAPPAKVRKRKLKGFGKKQLRKIVEDAPGLSSELQTFGRLILGDITGEQALKEIPALKGYVKMPRAAKPKKGSKKD